MPNVDRGLSWWMRVSGTVRIALLCAAWLLFAEARGVRAQSVDLTPEPRHLAVSGELGFFGDDQGASELLLFAPRVSAHYALDERWSIAGDFGAVLFSQTVDRGEGDDFAAGPSNLAGYVLYRGEFADLRYRAGLGGSAPLARIDREGSGRLLRTAYSHAQALRGLFDVWLFAPSRGALLGYAELEGDLHPEAQFELEVAPALMIPAYEAFSHDRVDVFIPTAVTLSTQRGPVRLGLRFQAVIMPADDPDALQLALEPQLRFVLGGGAFVEARYTHNLDEPLAGERGPRIWGAHVAAGGTL